MKVELVQVTPDEALRIGWSAAVRLAEMVKPEGRFTYLYGQSTGDPPENQYSMVRHAGCVWALNQAASILLFERGFHNARKRALEWLFEANLAASPQQGLCIVEGGKSALGATALAIVALLSYEESCDSARGDSKDQLCSLVAALCDHILAQVTTDGDFIHLRDMRTGAAEPFRSRYFTGEALFALFTALEWFPNPQRLNICRELFHNLTEQGYGLEQQSHWMMYAAEVAYTLAPDPAIMSYADRLTEGILTNPLYRVARCTPIACRTEALLSYLRILQHAGRTDCEVSNVVLNAIRDNLCLQLRDRLPDGGFCRGAGDSTVRMDFIQHNLAAFLGYSQLSDTP